MQPSGSDTLAAFLAAPWLGALTTSLTITPLLGLFDAWGLYFGFSILVAYPVALLLGLPAYLLMVKLVGQPALWHCSLAGACLAALSAGALFHTVPGSSMPVVLLLSVTCGVVTGSSVWAVLRVIARKRHAGAA